MHDDMLTMTIHGGADHALSVETGPADGPFAVTDPVVDVDGDGVLDTRGYADGNGVTVASDLDGDGFADHLTRVEDDGAYASWEPRRDPDGTLHWVRTDGGHL
ncbi:DUF6802 family protein [Rhodococcus sp. NPDC003318]|uniref:DUF6802 family protein n=1 Tax=Rhodococcus sp. NPDC003318 TaxID=3364503 RepID=UPI003699427D